MSDPFARQRQRAVLTGTLLERGPDVGRRRHRLVLRALAAAPEAALAQAEAGNLAVPPAGQLTTPDGLVFLWDVSRWDGDDRLG